MISIGNRKVLFSETLLCPVEEYINIKVDIPNEEELWLIKIIFSTDVEKNTKNEEKKPLMNWRIEDNVWILNFVNWNSSLGSIFTSPVEIAKSIDNKPITLLAEIANLTSMYRINLQIMLDQEATND